jgi:protein TonB
MPTPSGPFETWHPNELGLPRATAASIALVVLIAAFCYWASVILAPKPKMQVVQITQAQLVTLPKPTPPPPPPKVVPPPKPLPAVIPKPLPVPSKIVVATKPPPPVHHVYKPVPRPVVHTPANGIPIYGRGMYETLEANQSVPPALASLGVSGTVYVSITVTPDGHVVSARIEKSSGVPLIDQTGLQHVLQAHFAPFNADMPSNTLTFTVPVNITPQSDGSGSDSGSDSDSDSN